MINKIHLRPFLEYYLQGALFSDHGADFTKVIIGGGYINDYIQVYGIKVDETGSNVPPLHYEPVSRRMSSTSQPFLVSRPFIFYLYNSNNNLVLHFAIVTDPFY
ncbi:hypothetical protein RF11_08244 [Thelohanellus kitauei]|uniref:Serpin domain-containing protein n=1 Tax=Thelohanellus kitauei TaxID=669202 RepID=A0A0C2JW21_THEKT|nr:hypothetical protein RF11_08244 [Thelohanellus kitauei]